MATYGSTATYGETGGTYGELGGSVSVTVDAPVANVSVAGCEYITTVSPPVADIAVSGIDINSVRTVDGVLVGVKVFQEAQGNLNVATTGHDVTIRIDVQQVSSVADVSVGGLAPTVSGTANVDISGADIAVAAEGATISGSAFTFSEIVDIAVSGQDATASVVVAIEAPVADIAVSGAAPELLVDSIMTAPEGVVDVAGLAVALGTDSNALIGVDAATIAVEGLVTGVYSQTLVETDTAAITVVGYQPAGNAFVEPAVADVSVAGLAPAAVIARGSQFLRPDGDVNSAWAQNAYSKIDEIVPNSTIDYISASYPGNFYQYAPETTTQKISLSNPNGDPIVHSGHTVRYQYRHTGSLAIPLTVKVYQGTTFLAEWVETTATSWTTRVRIMDASAAALITDYNDLQLWFVATTGYASESSGAVQVSWAEMEIPEFDPGTHVQQNAPAANLLIAGPSPLVFPGEQSTSITVDAPSTVTVEAHPVAISNGNDISLITTEAGIAVQGHAPAVAIENGPVLISTSSAAARTAGNFTIPAPAGILAGDLLIAAVTERGGDLGAPSGWTLIADSGAWLRVFAKVAGASEPGSYLFPDLQPTGTASIAGVIALYRGANDPAIEVIGSFSSGSSSEAVPLGGVTTESVNGRLLGIWNVPDNTWVTPSYATTFTAPPSMRLVGAKNSFDGTAGVGSSDSIVLITDESLGAAGATGSRTGTVHFGGDEEGSYYTIALALTNAASEIPGSPTIDAPVADVSVAGQDVVAQIDGSPYLAVADPGSISVAALSASLLIDGSTMLGIDPADVLIAGAGVTVELIRHIEFLADTVDIPFEAGVTSVRTGPDHIGFRFTSDAYTGLTAADAVPLTELNFGPFLHGQEKRLRFRLGNESSVATTLTLRAVSSNSGVAAMVQFSPDNITYAESITLESIPGNGMTDVVWVRMRVTADAFIGRGDFLIEVVQNLA